MKGVITIGPFTIFIQWYNGVAFGIKTEEIYELTAFKQQEDEEELEVTDHTAWVIILPLVSIYITI